MSDFQHTELPHFFIEIYFNPDKEGDVELCNWLKSLDPTTRMRTVLCALREFRYPISDIEKIKRYTEEILRILESARIQENGRTFLVADAPQLPAIESPEVANNLSNIGVTYEKP